MPLTPGRPWRHPIVSLTLLASVAGGAYAAAPADAADVRAPRIVAAAMQDADGDNRADRLRLTYSERVRHAADRDGRFPFRVTGYRVRAVGRASGRTIVVKLAEQSAPDHEARPAVRYGRTRAQRVTDRARNQAARQAFRATRPHANAPGGPAPTPGPGATPTPGPGQTPTPPAASDQDGDGTLDAQDCAPADPAVHPGAPDLPDLGFLDSDCDGIDGSVKDAIFVSVSGDDANPGTPEKPKVTLQAAVLAAALAGKDLYVAGGDYSRVETVSGADIYGGYIAGTWKRDLESRTRIAGTPEGVLATGDTVKLQLLTVVGIAAGAAGSSAYAVRAVDGADVTLQRVALLASSGTAGYVGDNGAVGISGGNGGSGENGTCDGVGGADGGGGGPSATGRPGGYGGRGGIPSLNRNGTAGGEGTINVLGGAGGLNGNPGKPGQSGSDGASGSPGIHGPSGGFHPTSAQAVWRGYNGSNGSNGFDGQSGGGGGGGGGQKGAFVIDGDGNGGGGGGGGGQGGGGGKGGGAGGGSFGLYLYNATAAVTDGSTISTTNGGNGGDGGHGGTPGGGGFGGVGGRHCLDEIGRGGNGGYGGMGGLGGGGGGGVGGPTVGVMKAGASTATLTGAEITIGAAGAAGKPGIGGTGTPADPGVAVPVYPAP